MGREHLAASGSAEAPIEAEVLLRHVLQLDRAAFYTGWNRPISEDASRIQDPRSKIQIVDVGTGSGCIAIALAHRCSQAKVYAIDVSPEALEVARINAARHGVNGRVEFLPGDLLTPLPSQLAGCIDAIVSNPPYIPLAQRGALPREIRDFEPAVCGFLDGGGPDT